MEGEASDQGDPTARTLALAQREITALRELLELAIKATYDLLDARINALDGLTSQRFTSQEAAVAAALAAAEKASTKTEGNVAEQIKQLGANFDAVVKRIDDRITAVETRVSKTEAAVGA